MFHVKHELINIKYCPICDNEKNSHFLSVKDHNVSNDMFKICKCDSCGFVFTNPKPSQNTIGDYYKSENYISHSGTKKGLVNSVYHLVRNYQIGKKQTLVSSLTKDKTILDVGCGTGEFISFCKDKKWTVHGTEPDKNARKINKVENNVFESIYSSELKNKTFNVITMWHVLEHVYNLTDDLERLKKLLEPQGHLVVAVPNHESYDAKNYGQNWAAYDVPIHLYHFRKKDIVTLFSKLGFTLKNVEPLFFDSYYISLLSEQKKGGNKINAIKNGLISNIKAKKNNNHSSLIYILQKNE
jgi:2-polyprenyl-3-methyl-5-hydroxy-6-metoxy-1,4-benzoquinol methylase